MVRPSQYWQRIMQILVFFLMAMILCGSCRAGSSLTAYTEESPPYQFIQKDGSLGGYAVEVMRAIALQAQGEILSIRQLPWSESYRQVLNTRNTILFSVARTREREDEFIWGEKLVTEKAYVWTINKTLAENIKSMQELQSHSFSVTQGSVTDVVLSRNKFNKIYRVKRPIQNIKMLYRGRVDFIVANQWSIDAAAKNTEINTNIFIRLFEFSELNYDLYFAFNKETPTAVVELYRRAYGKLKKDGSIKKLQQKWNVD